MSIGYALIVIFVLYLIDKHNHWRQAALIGGGLIALAAVGLGSVYGWQEYQSRQSARRIALQQAASKAACLDSAKLATTNAFIPDTSVCDTDASYRWKPACQNSLVIGCIDDSPQPWKKYGPTQIYELDGKRYEVPKDTTLDELDEAIKSVSKDAGYLKASPEDQKGYLAYVIESNRKNRQSVPFDPNAPYTDAPKSKSDDLEKYRVK